MNANELADELEEFSGDGAFKYYLEIATMLRQQQAEIEALKNRNWELVSEPWGFDRQPADLTDEEIDSIGDEVSNLIDTYAGRREFARAILRKAQEK